MIIEEDSSCVDDDSLLGSEKNQRGARIELSAILCSETYKNRLDICIEEVPSLFVIWHVP